MASTCCWWFLFPPMLISAMDIILGLEQLRSKYQKPVVGVIMATEEFQVELNRDHPNHMALYIFPDSAVNALAALDRYRVWREKPVGEVKHFEVRVAAFHKVFDHLDDVLKLAGKINFPSMPGEKRKI